MIGPLVHDHDPVGQGQRRQAVGDDDRGPVAGELLQHAVDQLLALQVDLAGGFVEDQDRRIAEDRPGQRDPLPLAAGEPASPGCPTMRLVAVFQPRLDELVGVGLPGGLDHRCRARLAGRRSECC